MYLAAAFTTVELRRIFLTTNPTEAISPPLPGCSL